MQKVLFVFNHPAPYKVAFFNELSKHVDLTVIFERKSERNQNKNFYCEKNYNFKTIFLKSIPFGTTNAFSFGVKRHIKKHKYDLIVMNGYRQFPEAVAIKYLQKKKIPYVLYINGGIIKKDESSFIKNLKIKYISGASYYFSPDSESNKYLSYYGANEKNIFNYPYSTIHDYEILNCKTTEQEKNNLRLSKNIKSDKLFVSCGQLIKRKNYFELLKKWTKMPKNHFLIIIGDGVERNKLENFIIENNLTNVKLTGYLKRSEIFEYYKMSDAFIFSSSEDIYGHVINEAMSQGLPVISTPNVNASKQLIKTNENGYIVPNVSSSEFDEAISKINYSTMFEKCISTAKENTIENMVKFHIEVFDRISK